MIMHKKMSAPGFSLTELIIYVLIIGVLMSVGVPMYLNYVQRAKETTTRQNLQLLKNQINLYQAEFGKYPTRLEDLVEKPKEDLGKKWRAFLEKLPRDGWNQEFYYRITSGGKHPYDLYSTGGASEGEEIDEKRISVWDL